MNARKIAIGLAIISGILFWGFNPILLKISTAVLVGTAARLALKNIPWLELVTVLTVYIGASVGPLAGAYVGFFSILLSDIAWYDFSNTLWNAPTFAAVGALSGILHLEFVVLVALMTLFYNIVVNTIVVLAYGASPFASIAWTVMHIFVNISIAGYLEPRLIALGF